MVVTVWQTGDGEVKRNNTQTADGEATLQQVLHCAECLHDTEHIVTNKHRPG